MSEETSQRLSRAIDMLRTGSLEEAVQELENLVKSAPDCIEAWYNLGYAYSLSDRPEDALIAYDEGLAIDNMIFELWFNKATVLYEMRDFKAALTCYEKAVEIRPDDPEAWNNLGNCHSRLGEGKKAIEAYTRAVALKPDYAEAFYNKANAHFIEGEHERAVAYAEVAVELDPNLARLVNEWIHVSRAHIAAEQDHKEYEKRKEKRGPRRFKDLGAQLP